MDTVVAVSAGGVLGVVLTVLSLLGWRRVLDGSTGDSVDYGHVWTDVDEPIVLLGPGGTVKFVNEAFRELVDTDPEGQPIEPVLSGVPDLQRRVVEGKQGGAVVEVAGETRYYEVTLHGTDSPGAETLVVCYDATEHHERRCELEAQNERLDQFASLVSHDLRNPLDVALGRTNAVAALAEEPETREHVESIQGALDRMETIIDDVLLLAREGEDIGDTAPTELEGLCEDCWERVETERAALDVRTDAVVEADESSLARLLENLFRNAVEHGVTHPERDGGAVAGSRQRSGAADKSVQVRVGSQPGGFYVEDDGPGIPVEKRDRFCQPGESGVPANTGFGLAIVERVAQAHGWTLHLTESDDGGARFEFTGVERATEGVAT